MDDRIWRRLYAVVLVELALTVAALAWLGRIW
jgi:hypothetical protein